MTDQSMTRNSPPADPRRRVTDMAAAISLAATLLQAQRATLEAYLAEARKLDSFGPVLAPALFLDPERRATDAVLRPMVAAALDYLRTVDSTGARARAALDKVTS